MWPIGFIYCLWQGNWKALVWGTLNLCSFVSQRKQGRLSLWCAGRLYEDHNEGLFYHRQLEVEWWIVFYGIGSAKGKLCSSQGHIFKQLLFGKERDPAFIAVSLLLFPTSSSLQLYSLRNWNSQNRCAKTIHINLVSSYSSAASSAPHKQLSLMLFVTSTLKPQENDK